MRPLFAIAALVLMGCGILDNLEEVVDPPPEKHNIDIQIGPPDSTADSTVRAPAQH